MKNKVVLKLWLRPTHTFLVLREIEHEKGKSWLFFFNFHMPLFLLGKDTHKAQLLYPQTDFQKVTTWSKMQVIYISL